MPLLVGVSCSWNAAAAALTFFPALAFTVFPMFFDPSTGAVVAVVLAFAFTLPYLIYAAASAQRAVRARASDVVLLADGIELRGGPHDGRRVAWAELTAPYAVVEAKTESRFRLGRLILGSFLMAVSLIVDGLSLLVMVLTKSADLPLVFLGSPWKKENIDVWKLHLHTESGQILVGVTDREEEAQSMQAAAESIDAIAQGRRYVEHAPAVAAAIVTCPSCGAPVVPAPAPAVVCGHCGARVELPPEVQSQAAASHAMTSSGAIVAKLLAQPPADAVNRRIFTLAAVGFFSWPVGWAIVAPRLGAGHFGSDAFAFLFVMPLTAIMAASFFSRDALTDRGALQLLTLGFGALAPRIAGAPSRCRRCQGPLPGAQLGGVVRCAYCGADNVVGLDLRPTVGAARAEQQSLDASLAKRASDRTRWTALCIGASLLMAGWIVESIAYLTR
jgi:hypothetical protein